MELPPEVLAICASAGTVLANSMATDFWETAKNKFAALFGTRRGEEQQVRMDRDRQAIISAPNEERAVAVERVAASWATRFQNLVEDQPELVRLFESTLKEMDEIAGAASVRVANSNISQVNYGGPNIFSGRDTRLGS